MKIGVAQAMPRDAIHRRRGDDAAEGARRSETLVVGHDEQHIRGGIRWYDAGGPPGRRFRSLLLDHAAEFRIGRWKLLSVDGGRGAGRTQLSRDDLPDGRSGKRGETQENNQAAGLQDVTMKTHGGPPPYSFTRGRGLSA